ncbi:biliverdin-producing heme oxygenase [Bosea sp. BK604]|uniref:biliverdin-producing heme oxygenase n=1 Tax=Bosea sp. BK604 TaxID=2512180 RepID=UPI0010EF88B1|nr:biliverdin-producing heme oxygenase [Bosea sp. BK604]TCR62919.1 heme oxygenase [Bosea sp. BK604]
MTPLRSFLRAETNELHRDLDDLIGPLASPSDYGRFLAGTYRHRAAVEAALRETCVSLPLGWRPRELASVLELDLAELGVHRPRAMPFSLSNDIASVLGASYVLEGSALGARVLVRDALRLGFEADRGARYLSAQSASPETWRDFLACLESLGRADWNRAADSARQVFSHAIQAFSSEKLPAA